MFAVDPFSDSPHLRGKYVRNGFHPKNGFYSSAHGKPHHVEDMTRSSSLMVQRPDWFGLRPLIDRLFAVISALGQYLQRQWRGEETPLIDRIRPLSFTADYAFFQQFVRENISYFNTALREEVHVVQQLDPVEASEAFQPAYRNLMAHARSLQRHIERAGLWMREHQEILAEHPGHEIAQINRVLTESAQRIGAAVRLAPNQGLMLQAAPFAPEPLTRIGVPLYNPNVKCFLNSLFQLVFMITPLRKYILEREEQNATIRRHAFHYSDTHFERDVHEVAPPLRGYDLSELVHFLGQGIRNEPHRMHDSQEVAAALFEPFNPTEELEHGNPLYSEVQLNLRLDLTPIEEGYGLDVITPEEQVRLASGTYSSARDPYSIFTLQFNRNNPELPSIESMIHFFCNSTHHDPTYVKNVEINHPDLRRVEPVPTRIMEEIRRFRHLPEFLFLQFKRFSFDMHAQRPSKINQIVDFPERFIIGGREFCEADEYAEYQNIGFVHHTGSVSHGHYISYIKNMETGNWTRINDLPGFGFPSEIVPVTAEEARQRREESYLPIIVKVRDVDPQEGRAAMKLRKLQVKQRELRLAIDDSHETARTNSPEATMTKLSQGLEMVRLFSQILPGSDASSLAGFFPNLPEDFRDFCLGVLRLEKGYTKESEALQHLKELAGIVTKYIDTTTSRNVVAQYLYIRQQQLKMKEMDIARHKRAVALVVSDKSAQAELATFQDRLTKLEFHQAQLKALAAIIGEHEVSLDKVRLMCNLLSQDIHQRLDKYVAEQLESEELPTIEHYGIAVERLLKENAESQQLCRQELAKVLSLAEAQDDRKESTPDP